MSLNPGERIASDCLEGINVPHKPKLNFQLSKKRVHVPPACKLNVHKVTHVNRGMIGISNIKREFIAMLA